MRADRLLSILMLLQSRGKQTAAALAAELGVSRRTILRDVDALSYAGVPLYADGGHGGGISLDENYRTTLTGLNQAEVRALFLTQNTQLLADLGLEEATRRMDRKLAAALPPEQHALVEQVRQRLYIDPAWWWQEDTPLPFWDELQRALFENRRVRVVYQNYSEAVAERILEPYALVAKASHWYLIARREGEYRMYRVTRFRSVELLAETFQRAPGFDLVSFWRSRVEQFRDALAEYTFTLRIHPEAVQFAQSLAPGRYQQLEDAAPDGWRTLRFRMESPELAQMLVFGLAGRALVLDPPELQAAVLENARLLLEQADDGPR